ncbi:MAG: hypothetical protein GXP63_04605 [DPANN group archaeon]|nr:hypothetical protein [DPANN group archaeon]
MEKKAQTYLSDLLFAIGIFLLTFIIFFNFLSVSESKRTGRLEAESVLIPTRLVMTGDNDTLAIIVDNVVDTTKLKELSNRGYTSIKNAIGVTNDFCIIFEDKDGNLINLTQVIGSPNYGIGSPRMQVEGRPCGRA